MKLPSLRSVATEAKLLLIGIPLLIWTTVRDLAQGFGFCRQSVADASDAA